MLRQLAVRATRGAFRRSRRQLQARWRVAGLRGSASGPDWATVTVGRLPVAARVDPTLSLPQQAAANLATLRSVLRAAEIDVWQVPANVSRPMLAARETDRARVIDALDHPDLAGWYRDRLNRRNRRELRLERPHAPLPGAVCGIVLWPYVVADPALTFRADQQQGVAVTFWTAEVDEPDDLRSDDEENVPVPAGVDLSGYDSAQDAAPDEDERAEPGDAELVDPELVDSELVDPELVDPELVDAEPVDLRRTATPTPATSTADILAPDNLAPDNPPETVAWRSPVRNGALEVVSAAEVVGLRGDVPPSARGHHLARVGFDVDVVYTWVDGSDPTWRERKLATQQAAAGAPEDHTERALDEVRFADHDELRHSLRSIEQFAPWVRHVWLVTGGQRPGWLAEHPRLTVVDHADIWPDGDGLPSFNSHAIESCLHRIEGLSEHFLYLNDDMILGRPVRPERFFHGSGVPKFFWSNALVDYLPVVPGEIASTAAAKNARRLVARECGVTFSRKFFHAPYPLRVSVLQELEERFGAEFAATRRAPFRTVEDIAAAGSLYFNYAYATGRSVPGQLGYAYVDPAGEGGRRQLQRLLRRRNVDSFCLNDGHTDQGDEERDLTDRLVREFLAAYLPVPSTFERVLAAGLPLTGRDNAAVTGA